MTLGYNVKKGLLILNEEGTIENKVKKEFYNKPYDDAGDGDYHKIKSLSEKAHELLEKRKRKEMESKSVDVYNEISNKPIVINGEKECLTSKNDKYVIDYSEAKGRKDFVGVVNPNLTTRKVDYSVARGRKDFVGQINKDKPQNKPVEDTDDIIFELHKEVVVDYGVYNLKELIDYTLNILDNILNSSSIPGPLKSAVNTSLKALVSVLSITSIGKWISFLTSLQKILGLVVNCSGSVGKFVERLEGLSKVSENSYKDSETISKIYSNAFGDLSENSINHKVGYTNNYTVEKILNSL